MLRRAAAAAAARLARGGVPVLGASRMLSAGASVHQPFWGGVPQPTPLNIFIRNAITQLKSSDRVARTEAVVNAIKAAPSDLLGRTPVYVTEMLDATRQREAVATRYTPAQFRQDRLSKLSSSEVFVFIYDEDALSVSGGVELGHWLAKQEAGPPGATHTVVVLMNTMSTTLVKMLPESTYIHLDDDAEGTEKLGDSAHFPNLIRVGSTDELSAAFGDVLRRREARAAIAAYEGSPAGCREKGTVLC